MNGLADCFASTSLIQLVLAAALTAAAVFARCQGKATLAPSRKRTDSGPQSLYRQYPRGLFGALGKVEPAFQGRSNGSAQLQEAPGCYI